MSEQTLPPVVKVITQEAYFARGADGRYDISAPLSLAAAEDYLIGLGAHGATRRELQGKVRLDMTTGLARHVDEVAARNALQSANCDGRRFCSAPHGAALFPISQRGLDYPGTSRSFTQAPRRLPRARSAGPPGRVPWRT